LENGNGNSDSAETRPELLMKKSSGEARLSRTRHENVTAYRLSQNMKGWAGIGHRCKQEI